jgi:hypothetical protein
MASWEEQTSPLVKFEDSPAESFLSAPGEMYSSLFAAATPTASSTVNPLDMMSPESLDEEGSDEAVLSALATNLDEASTPATGATEKKTTKKRKSWGQVLPEPKTNLPPRYAVQSLGPQPFHLTVLENGPRQKTRRSSDEWSVSYGIAELPSLRGNASDWRRRPSSFGTRSSRSASTVLSEPIYY